MADSVNIKYTQFKKKKCEVCGCKKALTIHHIVGQEFIRQFKRYQLQPRDLATLCRDCHDDVEAEIEIMIKAGLGSSAMYDAVCQAKSDFGQLKVWHQGKDKCKDKDIKKRMENTVLLALGGLNFKKTPNWPIVHRFDHLKGMDEEVIANMLRTYYRAWKLKQKVFKNS